MLNLDDSRGGHDDGAGYRAGQRGRAARRGATGTDVLLGRRTGRDRPRRYRNERRGVLHRVHRGQDPPPLMTRALDLDGVSFGEGRAVFRRTPREFPDDPLATVIA